MSRRRHLVFNGKPVEATAGESLIDAALGGSILIPHDCRSGQCESCRVTILSGLVDDHGTAEGRTVLACQATVSGDAEVLFEELPLPVKRAGVIVEINNLSPEIVEVVMATSQPLEFRPGQYVRLKLAGFPAREFSPTFRMDGSSKSTELVFHVRRLTDGLVSSELGAGIRPGHAAHVQGPFGQAYLRGGEGPLVLVAGGTGWAPIWALARAARLSQPGRELMIIAGSRDADNLYMRPSLDWLSDDGVREIIATTEIGAVHPIKPGRPTQYLPLLGIEDTVHVAGPSALVDAVKNKARSANAPCYGDAFLPSSQGLSLMDRITRRWRVRQEPQRQDA
ncbi:3-phenylpropionate/trans-cinnamate dioxygenase ferredoxin reductase subunit [Rhizobiales bacterium GAS188]|nr:3-phenylpropionate/trans-cinnamate dioxygenase ferredoxin reductase subunit [Rhizobiales bacterium GAS188]